MCGHWNIIRYFDTLFFFKFCPHVLMRKLFIMIFLSHDCLYEKNLAPCTKLFNHYLPCIFLKINVQLKSLGWQFSVVLVF